MDKSKDQNGRESPQIEPNALNQADVRSTIRAVTPEPSDTGASGDPATVQATRGFGATSPTQSSPRSIPGGERRRQGMVFSDASFEDSIDSAASSPPAQAQFHSQPPQSPKGPLRPRTQTMDGALALRQQTTSPGHHNETRHRVGSLSSSGSQPVVDLDSRTPPVGREGVAFAALSPGRPPDLKVNAASSSKKERSSNKRLIKRGSSSRPTSPLVYPPPSVDSLPLPIPTDDANKILLLMKTLCGRMRGEVEYQSESGGAWYGPGICYIDEERGSLLFDGGQSGSVHLPLVSDLRGCRVLPVENDEGLADGRKVLELNNARQGFELRLRPTVFEEFDLWLASLLCWQQLRPSPARPSPPNRTGSGSPIPGGRPEGSRQRGASTTSSVPARDAAIIKVGKVMLWDKGLATSPRAIVKRPSTRDLRSGTTSWRRVSCLLQDDGQFKFMTENDVTVLSIIELSQLSRRAVQQLHKSVLDEEFCIAIFPIYSSSSRQLSIFRPVYLAFDTKVLLEVWFVLLRAYAVPDLYGLEPSTDQIVELADDKTRFEGQIFRIEKTIEVRVTEAKLRRSNLPPEIAERHARDRDLLIGNYLAEVILDGEVRARTTIQADTKNPFWRDTFQFNDLPATLPLLSVILKRVDGNLDSFSHQLQASLGLPKTGNLTENIAGSVDIALASLERRKDHEQWHTIYDEKGESIGTLFAKVSHDELVVLPAEDYKQLSDLLHQFSTGLTNQISLATPSALRRLAETFLNIFQVTGKSAEWLMALVEEEVDGLGNPNSAKRLRFSRRLRSNESSASASDREQLVRDMGKSLAGEANLLFRGNTLLTQALEFHMRRLGKDYLETVLSDKVFEINELNPDCEVDPSRIQRVEDLEHHWASLLQLTAEIWDCIAVSAPNFPAEIRTVVKYVRAVADDRYGDFLRTVSYTSVSGFMFLRFICPAILNPKLFGLLKDNPRPRAQRTLTLIAKGLQALANLSSFGKKESWMEPMNKFVASHKQPFKDFIDQICAVPAERETATPLSASYSTPIQILGRLPPISKEGFPSLPHLIDHPRSCASLVKLWVETNRSTTEDSIVFEGELAEFHRLCEDLQTRANICFDKMESHRATEGLSEDVTESLEKASLLDASNMSHGSPSWAETDPYRGACSSGSEIEGSDRRGWDYRVPHALRQISESADLANKVATIRAKGRAGGNPRTFLSGLIGKGRDKALSPSSTREKSRDKEDKSSGGARGKLGFTEARHGESSSRH